MAHLIYIADPMCSWCWGFSPVITALEDQFRGRLPVSLLMGGLRPYTAEPMPDKDRSMIREHWEHVAARTGQPFDYAFFDRPEFVYDTEPASRAVVTAQALRPGSGLDMLKAVQRGFYAENRDVTDEDVLAEIAVEEGFEAEMFAAALASDEARAATREGFATSQNAGIRGFPALLAGDPSTGYGIVTNGYQPLESLAEPLEQWLTQQSAANDA
ncbi:MAG: DsbA family protein [Hyphomicrobiaceae bacterium]